MTCNVLCCDFDGVIATYAGWTNEGYTTITGTPMAGVKDALKQLRNEGWIVFVHSTRCSFTGGLAAIVDWLNKYNIRVDGVCSNKPPADVYVDDKGIRFNGDWMATVNDVKKYDNFRKSNMDA